MDRTQLLKRVKTLGYPLIETKEAVDANETLAEVVKSKELRLWEGFPIILANCLEKSLFDYKEVSTHLKNEQEKATFLKLVVMSFALYIYLELELSFADKLKKSPYFDIKLSQEFLSHFKGKRDLPDFDGGLSTIRIVKTFKNYFSRAGFDLKEVVDMHDEFELEYAMSQIFSKKQKEIFLKKLKGEKLSKTEREYFSRSIKKKVLALANPDLHKLAVRLFRE